MASVIQARSFQMAGWRIPRGGFFPRGTFLTSLHGTNGGVDVSGQVRCILSGYQVADDQGAMVKNATGQGVQVEFVRLDFGDIGGAVKRVGVKRWPASRLVMCTGLTEASYP